MKVECHKRPRIYITPEVKQRLDLYIKCCKYEISGLGEAIQIDDDFFIQDIFILPQEVSAGHTDLDSPDVGQYLTQLLAEDKDPTLAKVWWHSHGDFSCFWSGIDTGTIERFNNDWMISIVGNRSGDYRARIDIYTPVRISVDELPLEVYVPSLDDDRKLEQSIVDEINSKVRVKRWAYTGFQGKSWEKWTDQKTDFPGFI